MIVYKFGGASLKSAEAIKNILNIVKKTDNKLVVVLSAINNTTNILEEVLKHFMAAEHAAALKALSEIEEYHFSIISNLFNNKEIGYTTITPLFDELKRIINEDVGNDYDRCYDQIVSFGELLASKLVSSFFNEAGLQNEWLDIRGVLVTDSNFREANINYAESERRMREAIDFSDTKLYITQGFIGTNMKGLPTTLGREGSDFSAAAIAYLLDAKSVTIWKDVPGILNADPRQFSKTTLIPAMNYMDAVELAFSGAKVIHPKTIKPLENKEIPLYVKPFGNPDEAGSIINNDAGSIDIPVLILKKDQVLITLRPLDFSFILEESLTWIFTVVEKYRLKVALIQSSAVSISICVNDSRYLQRAMDELANDFKVSYNTGVELLTIRGANPEIIEEATEGKEILVQQQTRRNGRFIVRDKEKK